MILSLPVTAAWRHQDARDGFEVAYFGRAGDWIRIEGCTTAVEDGQTWAVEYRIDLDGDWVTRKVGVAGRSATESRRITLEADGVGNWQLDGRPAPHLDGCFDIDLESSALTNALPIRRLRLAEGASADTPAAYVRAVGLGVERLDQRYTRIDDNAYDYQAPRFDFRCRLDYDQYGLVLEYPGIAVRAA